ncbi:Protein of unknown function [Clostridium cavendishii DSM 21758]|uniref:DUF3006 domain-containing protein n=1 Tax=Clostridium cavendishii DSM 21758 TaxID=1121302 RepID=A0A1M6QK85_9CLOT|nr:DUF3006 domain-containing protein [Clostridium cavendishii]SHK20699.1 Protein of unknown function [Clostridium cavendishii DSM 21758]
MFNEKLTYIVDRIEENLVVCENKQGDIINIASEKINGKPKDGDVLVEEENLFYIDDELTKKRRREIEFLMKGMWE